VALAERDETHERSPCTTASNHKHRTTTVLNTSKLQLDKRPSRVALKGEEEAKLPPVKKNYIYEQMEGVYPLYSIVSGGEGE